MDNNDQIEETETFTPDNSKRIFDVYEPLFCKLCNKSFKRKTSFKSHMETHENDSQVTYSKKKSDQEKNRAYTCKVCEKGFTAKKNLLKHLRVIHKNLNEAEKLQIKKTRCPESNCLFTCRKMGDLRSHIEKYHEIKILKDTLHFLNEEGFKKWKKEEEDNSVASFVSFRRKGILKNGMVKKVLLCHRTGQYHPKGKGKHRLKSHGSCKIGGTCPAAMEIIQCPDGQITVSYYKTHLGHSKDIVHLQLSKEEKEKLSERIEQGFSLDAILEDAKESFDPETGKTKRIHLLSRKDLYNIMQSSNKKIKTSLKSQVEELFLNVTEEPEVDLNSYGDVTDFEIVKEHDLQLLGTADIVESDLTLDNNVENEPDFSKEFEILQNEVPNVNEEILNDTSSQLVIVNPDTGYKSLAEVILFQPNDSVIQDLSSPSVLPQSEESEIIMNNKNIFDDQQMSSLRKSGPKHSKSRNLVLKLEEKMKKIRDFLPYTRFLTPKQYDIVNKNMDCIINVYNSTSVKERSRKYEIEDIESENENEDENLNESENTDAVLENNELGIECIFTDTQNLQENQQQVYESPLYTYVCNYN